MQLNLSALPRGGPAARMSPLHAPVPPTAEPIRRPLLDRLAALATVVAAALGAGTLVIAIRDQTDAITAQTAQLAAQRAEERLLVSEIRRLRAARDEADARANAAGIQASTLSARVSELDQQRVTLATTVGALEEQRVALLARMEVQADREAATLVDIGEKADALLTEVRLGQTNSAHQRRVEALGEQLQLALDTAASGPFALERSAYIVQDHSLNAITVSVRHTDWVDGFCMGDSVRWDSSQSAPLVSRDSVTIGPYVFTPRHPLAWADVEATSDVQVATN